MQKPIKSLGNAAQTTGNNNEDAWVSTHSLSGYQITDLLYAGSRTLVYRAIRESNGQQVVVKLLRNEMPTFSELVQFRNQYAIMRGITDSSNTNIRSGIIQPYSLENCGNSCALVMEDFGGISLSQFTQKQQLEIPEFLDIAIQLADILHHLYQHRVIHKDIKPANILIHPETKQVKLIDFSISSLLPRETQEIQNLKVLEGTLAYLSPEQTGRMNRGIDYRSDCYALGVTFYQLLAGKLPFQSKDPMELIHSHLAKTPQPLHAVNSSVPAVISKIVAKLMAKNAEDRYQSAMGLKRDLEICLHQWEEIGTIAHFTIAQEDRCDRFIIPEKLYGRESEVAALLSAFDRVASPPENRVANGSSELMLVAGFSGIGKTAVINEVHKPIVRQKGYFIKGKFDQFQRNIPFFAFVQAFRDLMAQLLGETKTKLEQWRTLILQAVGENGQVIIDVIPELERIIGKQPPVPELSGSAAQNRFNLLFQKFLKVFTAKEHPLVMFLDDLQWADSASLALLKLLLSETETGYLLVLGAYRDNEVFPAHPLMLALEEIKKARATINTITLTPLDRADINQLVAATLNCSTELAQPLTDLTYQKTNGNPFFATQFLKALYGDRSIAFNLQENHWECDLAQVKAAALTSDVVEFMAAQLRKLPIETQEMLKLAACIGNSFDLTTLAIVSEKSLADAAGYLWKALQSGLVLPISETYKFFQSGDTVSTGEISVPYRFLHDRVQQAAYSLIPDDQKQSTHLKVGKLLLTNTLSYEIEEKIFDIVNHLNIGAELIGDRTARNQLASLNLIAGRKAKTSTAYAAAVDYLNIGRNLLAEDSWFHLYDLTLDLYVEAVEAEYLNTNFEQSHQLVEVVLSRSQNLLDKFRVYKAQIQSYIAQNQMKAAVDTGLQVLEMLGVSLERELPSQVEVSELANLPEINNDCQFAALRILCTIASAAYLASPELYPAVVFTMAHICSKYGNSAPASYAYACCSLICEVIGEIELGYQYGQLSLQVLDKFTAKEFNSKVVMVYNACARHWKEPSRATIPSLLDAVQSGLETGDNEYACYAAMYLCIYSFFSGEDLTSVNKKYARYTELMLKLKQEYQIYYTKIWRQIALNLQGLAEDKCRGGESFNEDDLLPILLEANNVSSIFGVYFGKLVINYLFGNQEQTVENAQLAEQYASGVGSLMMVPQHNFYYSLAMLAQYPNAGPSEREQYWSKVEENQEKMKIWADHAPMNYQHKYDLVAAEKERLLGCKLEAMDLYDRAINLAKQNAYIQDEALAKELAAKFYLDWGKERFAAGYMQDAYYCYAKWGAKAKVEDLETRYPQLLTPILQRAQIRECSPLATSVNTFVSLHQTVSSNSPSLSNRLDISTVLKAAQILYSEIHLDKLIATLMQVIVETSGADKAALFLDRDGELEVVIKYLDNTILCLEPKPVDECQYFPTAVIHYVERTLETVITDFKTNPIIARDLYFTQHQPASLLCTPILDRGKLIGVLYLENSIASQAFTGSRVELLKFLCSQAAISLQNARLYQQSQNYAAQLSQKSQQLEQTLAELQTMQLQLVQNEKMSALGNLVAGVAHEINNPVGCIIGNVNATQDYINDLLDIIDLYQDKFPQPGAEIAGELKNIDLDYVREDLPKLIKAMKDGGTRITSISKSLRTFSRADSDTKQLFNLHEGIDSTLLILRHRLKANQHRPAIEVVTNYGKIPEIACFPGQLNQVFMNILANAIDALDESNLGRSFKEIQAHPNRITIETKIDGGGVKIAIADNGPGMSEEVKARIFDHLFTTKAVGKGTGLGLAIARQIIVEKHGGAIEVDSVLGQGTTFAILLQSKI